MGSSSCVGVWKNGDVQIIANSQGNRTTPSCVAFTSEERLVGDAALNQLPRNPLNTVLGAKRLIGRKFADSEVQSDLKLWPFSVSAGDADKPEDISAMILSEMKTVAESFTGA